MMFQGFPGGLDGKEYACNAGDMSSIPGNIPWRREWLPTPVFLPGEFHGQRSLTATIPGVAESNTAEPLHFTSHTPLKSLPMAKSVSNIYF